MVGRFIIIFCLVAATVSAEFQDSDEKELELPISGKKRVVAHYMPAAVFFEGCRVPDNCIPAYYSPDGEAAKIGGLVQAVPMSGILRPEVSLDEAAEHEIRAAKLAGLDGFQFFYPFGGRGLLKQYNRTIAAFYRVAEKKFPDFKLTLCLCCSECKLDEAEAVDQWSQSINELLDECRESPAWLKTPDGRYLFYTWCPDGLAGSMDTHHATLRKPELIADTAAAYRRLADACGIRAALIYHLRKQENKRVLKAVLDNFPAVWGWTDSYATDDGWVAVAEECRRRKRTYTQTIYPDYYTSKLYNLDTHTMIHRLHDVLEVPFEKLGRETQNCGVTHVYRNLLERAVELDPPLINVATWNDFGEGHHLAPEINHNFAFGVLLNHYKRQWLGLPPEGEWAAVFYKKYPKDVHPTKFDFNVFEKRTCGESEDVIELVTHLKSAARLELNGQSLGTVAPGFQVKRVPIRPGSVALRVTRDGNTVLAVTGDEWITDTPYRTDRLTYGKSTLFDLYFKTLYGDAEPPVSEEYRRDQ
jgi:hypothetical protein